MINIVRSFFGTYTPIEGLEGVASIDFEWIAGVLLFSICLISVFKLLGVFLSK